MDVKNRSKAEIRNRAGLTGAKLHIKGKPRMAPCPFCGNAVMSSVANSGIRFFNCGNCGAKVSFSYSDEDESVVLWNERVMQ